MSNIQFCDSQNNYNFVFKFIIVGDSTSGKSSILQQFLYNKFDNIESSTIGIDFGTKFAIYNDPNYENKEYQICKLQLWDTAGQERFKSIIRSYFRNCTACIVVFDLTNEKTYENCLKWYQEIEKFQNSNQKTIILLGNKVDLINERKISKVAAQEFAESIGAHYLETSAKYNTNITEAFTFLTQNIINKINSKNIDPHNNNVGVRYIETGFEYGTLPDTSNYTCCWY